MITKTGHAQRGASGFGAVLVWLAVIATVRPAAPAALGSIGPSLIPHLEEEKPLRRVELLVLEAGPHMITIGLHVELAPGWYLYWLNPGDAGLAPEVRWKLPPSYEAGKLRFPAPEKFVHSDIVTYGFPDEALILCDILLPAKLPTEDKPLITAVLGWMACKESCVTGESRSCRKAVLPVIVPLYKEIRTTVEILQAGDRQHCV